MSWFDAFKTDDASILANKRANIVYVADFASGSGKYISTVFEDRHDSYDLSVKISPKVEVRVTYLANEEKIQGVQITKLSQGKTEKVNLSTLSFEGVLNVLQIFSTLDLKALANRSLILDTSIIDKPDELKKQLSTILADEKGSEILAELAEAKGLSVGDIGNVSKKKEALTMFRSLLTDPAYFEARKTEWGKSKKEDVWQYFFEKNKWIFGYGLEYVFNAPIQKDKFEAVLKGADFNENGKRPDGLVKTLGVVNFLNIVEIKTHDTELVAQTAYRAGVWQPSNELVGAITQCQQYIRSSMRNLNECIEIKDKDGNRTSEEVFRIAPRCFLVVGSLEKSFCDDRGTVKNPDSLACFESFRANTMTPEIITFDQLYERARHIVERHK